MSKPDVNYRSIADVQDVLIENERISPIFADDFDDVLKLSNARNITVRNCVVLGGREDAVDMNRHCQNVLIEDCLVGAGKQYAFTIKGGCSRITLRNVIITPRGGSIDIDLGNWSDQSKEPTRLVHLHNVTRVDGKPVRVRVGNADKPTISGGNVEVLGAESFWLRVYLVWKSIFPKFA